MFFRSEGDGQSGQAAVESAIVLPLFVFLILGTLQLGLMHQARLLTKYAAYKAVRAGALHHADVTRMERAALAVLLPLVSRAAPGGAEHIAPVDGAGAYLSKWKWSSVRDNQMEDTGMKHVVVTICGPLSRDLGAGRTEVDFDDPQWAGSEDWRKSHRTKLRIQVTFNYRMPIPFANQLIHMVGRNQEVPSVLRLGKREGPERTYKKSTNDTGDSYAEAADKGVYVLPIRATYTLRMQSNLFPEEYPLPTENACVFPFSYK